MPKKHDPLPLPAQGAIPAHHVMPRSMTKPALGALCKGVDEHKYRIALLAWFRDEHQREPVAKYLAKEATRLATREKWMTRGALKCGACTQSLTLPAYVTMLAVRVANELLQGRRDTQRTVAEWFGIRERTWYRSHSDHYEAIWDIAMRCLDDVRAIVRANQPTDELEN